MKRLAGLFLIIFSFLLFTSCSTEGENSNSPSDGVSFSQINFTPIELSFAKEFSIAESHEGYYLLTVHENENYIFVKENASIPTDIPKDITLIKGDLENIYNASSSSMDFFLALDEIKRVTMTGTDKNDWTLKEISQAIENEAMFFVGKYSTPDYEFIADMECDLAIENTMISHSPKVKELLESLGIPVLVEYSSYENHPLGRMEWIKLYGVLTGKYEEACEIFNEEVELVNSIEKADLAKKRVAFFYFSSNGYAVVRKPGDYITKMIEMAGGEYAFENAIQEEDNNQLTMRMQMETFFSEGYDADIIIYNSTIDGGIEKIDDLTEKNDVLKNFKAIENHQVYCTKKNFFQSTMSLGKMIKDFNKIIENPNVEEEELEFIYRID